MANTPPRLMPVLGNVHPIKIKIKFFFRDVISLLARVFILLIDAVTQEVPMKNAIEFLHVKTSPITLNDVRSSPHLAH